MKRFKKLFLLLFILVSLLVISGCKKQNEETNENEEINENEVNTNTNVTLTFVDCNEALKSLKVKPGTVLTEKYAPSLKIAEYGEIEAYWDCTFPITVTEDTTIYSVRVYINYATEANKEFDELLEDLFYDTLGTDPLSINFNLYHPENFYKEGVFDFDECTFEGYDFSEEGTEEYYKTLKEYVKLLESYEDTSLTYDQYLAKIVLLDTYNKELAYDGYFYYGTELGSYLGYQAQLPSTLAEYRFDNKKCIEDYLSYIEYTQSIFEGIVNFEKEKAKQGNPLTDEIINRVIEQCDEYINADSDNPNFLIPVITNKINNCTFLTDEEKADYIKRNTELVNGKFVQAYVYLRSELEGMLGQENNVKLENGEKYYGTYAQMKNGKEYYEAMLQDALGTTQSVDEIYKYLTKKLGENITTYSAYYDKIREYEKSNVMLKNGLKLNDLIPYFMEAIKSDFPDLEVTLDWSIGEVDKSLQENSSPAYYFVSPIDDNLTESIYVNPSVSDLKFPSNYMYSTIAHEGYPGHLYQNVYMKNLTNLSNVQKLISYNSYSEGWATYIEHYVLKYVCDDEKMSDIMLASDSIAYLVIGIADIKANYYGASLKEIVSFIQNYYAMPEDEIEDIYYDITEIPTNYLMYYYSAFRFVDDREMFKDLMGEYYSDKLYHEQVLKCGNVSFEVLESRLKEFAYNYCKEMRSK